MGTFKLDMTAISNPSFWETNYGYYLFNRPFLLNKIDIKKKNEIFDL